MTEGRSTSKTSNKVTEQTKIKIICYVNNAVNRPAPIVYPPNETTWRSLYRTPNHSSTKFLVIELTTNQDRMEEVRSQATRGAIVSGYLQNII